VGPREQQGAAANVKFADISGYLKNSVICPSGGIAFADSYTLNTVADKPLCQKVPGAVSPPAHRLPDDTGA